MYEIFPKIGFNYKDILIFLKLYFFTLFLGKEEKIVIWKLWIEGNKTSFGFIPIDWVFTSKGFAHKTCVLCAVIVQHN